MFHVVSRMVTLVLLDEHGRLLGALPPFEVQLPWWQEVEDVVAGAKRHHQVDITVLRLLEADRPVPPGGNVTYLATAEAASGTGAGGHLPTGAQAAKTRVAAVQSVDQRLAVGWLGEHPKRAPWARPEGPRASLEWAAAALGAASRAFPRATQLRTWNLSSIWRLDTGAGHVWLKEVPPFLAHEGPVLCWLRSAAPGRAPVPIAQAGGRMLLEHASGTDRYDAGPAERLSMLADLHDLQLHAAGHTTQLLALGVPDLRRPALAASLRDVASRHGPAQPAWVRRRLDRLIASLDERLDAIAQAGLPDTLVHGDFHPGNMRGTPDRRVVLDWGDSVIGHPGFDLLRMCEGAPNHGELRAQWSNLWRRAVPTADPDRAVELLRPLAALRAAAVYASFLDNIEPSEWPYHAADVGAYLQRAVAPASAGATAR
jgi:hypothetical protein